VFDVVVTFRERPGFCDDEASLIVGNSAVHFNVTYISIPNVCDVKVFVRQRIIIILYKYMGATWLRKFFKKMPTGRQGRGIGPQ